MTRAVLDTNVFVSAFLLRGRLNRLADAFLRGAFGGLLSSAILEEYLLVASRPLFQCSPGELETTLFQIKERAEWIETRSQLVVVAQDPADDQFLAGAVDGRANWLVTGDHHLLALDPFQGIRIRPPAEFLKALRAT